MKTRLRTVLLLGMLLAAACAKTPASTPAAVLPPSETKAAPTVAPTATLTFAPEPTTSPVPEAATALPVATSRGPNLEATDPSMVALASGSLQLVEFFRFT